MGVANSTHVKGMMLGKEATAAILVPTETIKAALFMLEIFFLLQAALMGPTALIILLS